MIFFSVVRFVLGFDIFFCRYFLRQSLLAPALQVIGSLERFLLLGKSFICNSDRKVVREQSLPDKAVEKRGDEQNADHGRGNEGKSEC